MVLDLFQLGLVHSPNRVLLEAFLSRHGLTSPCHVRLLAFERYHGEVGASGNVGHSVQLGELRDGHVHHVRVLVATAWKLQTGYRRHDRGIVLSCWVAHP